jgi:hypothetical protein
MQRPASAVPEAPKQAVCPAIAKQNSEAAARMAKLTARERRYTLEVKVTDPEGHEVLTLIKLTLEHDLQGNGNSIPGIGEVLELLAEAAKEYVLPPD